MSRSSFSHLVLACALPGLALLASCASTPTQIVVVAEHCLQVPNDIDELDVEVQQSSGMATVAKADLTTLSPPFTVGLHPDGSFDSQFVVALVGRKNGMEVLRREAKVRFAPGATRMLRLRLVHACIGNTCNAGQTCTEAGCQATAIATLPAWPGTPPPLDCTGATTSEVCNGRDDDGDGMIDEGFDTQTDPLNCGHCGVVCPPVLHGSPICASGRCDVSCEPHFHECSGQCYPDDDVDHCGASCARCNPNNASVACVDGSCMVTCQQGWGDCNGMASDGCETPLGTHDACQRCGDMCPMSSTGMIEYCQAHLDPNSNTCSSMCNTSAGLTACSDGSCVSLDTDPGHCGDCETNCAVTMPHALTACMSRVCVATGCQTGFADCDSTVAGCETNTDSDPMNCRTCGNVCNAPTHATAGCHNGTCGIGSCLPGWADCNSSPGCETPITGTTTSPCSTSS